MKRTIDRHYQQHGQRRALSGYMSANWTRRREILTQFNTIGEDGLFEIVEFCNSVFYLIRPWPALSMLTARYNGGK